MDKDKCWFCQKTLLHVKRYKYHCTDCEYNFFSCCVCEIDNNCSPVIIDIEEVEKGDKCQSCKKWYCRKHVYIYPFERYDGAYYCNKCLPLNKETIEDYDPEYHLHYNGIDIPRQIKEMMGEKWVNNMMKDN